MSRIGSSPVEIPSDVEVTLDGPTVVAKGKNGELAYTATAEVVISREDNLIKVKPVDESLASRRMWGTARAQIANLVAGVSHGFTKQLVISGTGYRAQIRGKDLVLALGFSHDVIYPIAEGLKIVCPDQTHIEIHGASKQQVGQAAAEIRAFRPPEPYKAKGIKYADEYVRRKEGKKK